MSGWLLDTVVVSELRKPRCDAQVRKWAAEQSQDSLHLSSVTMAEIRYGIGRIAPGDPFRTELEAWLEGVLRPWFAGRILAVDEDVLVAWREMVQRGRVIHHTLAQPDLFIAAIAQVHGLTVVTRNVDDFEVAGVPVLNPWLPPSPSLSPPRRRR